MKLSKYGKTKLRHFGLAYSNALTLMDSKEATNLLLDLENFEKRDFEVDPRIKRILDHYGLMSQLEKLPEEARKLQEASQNLHDVINAYEGEDRQKRIAIALIFLFEKMVAVGIMCDQMELGFELQEECRRQRDYELDHQLKKIENE